MGWLRLGAAILAIVAVTGLVSVSGGLGGPSTTSESGSVVGTASAGVAAKGWASGRADLNRDGTVTPAEVRRWIREHARDVTDGHEAGPGYDPASGAGLPILP